MVPSDSSEPPRSEVSKVKWFTEGVSFTLTREDLVQFCTKRCKLHAGTAFSHFVEYFS